MRAVFNSTQLLYLVMSPDSIWSERCIKILRMAGMYIRKTSKDWLGIPSWPYAVRIGSVRCNAAVQYGAILTLCSAYWIYQMQCSSTICCCADLMQCVLDTVSTIYHSVLVWFTLYWGPAPYSSRHSAAALWGHSAASCFVSIVFGPLGLVQWWVHVLNSLLWIVEEKLKGCFQSLASMAFFSSAPWC